MDEWENFRICFSQAVRNRRIALGTSQSQLAKSSGFSRSYIADVERGARSITLKTAWKLAECLQLQFSDLITQAENQNNGKTDSPKSGINAYELGTKQFSSGTAPMLSGTTNS